MYLNSKQIRSLATIIIGDSKIKISEYLKGPEIVDFLNQFGFNDDYWNDKLGGLSRLDFTISKLNELNGSSKIENVILEFVNPSRYWDSDFNIDTIANAINQIISDTAYSLVKAENKYFVKCNTELLSTTELIAHFTEIQDKIIEEIKKAKYLVWISIAWFTDSKIFNELIKKANEGVNIQVIIGDDQINSNSGLKFEHYFETYRISPFGFYNNNNILHNKFCIIDLITTITGSYNYTNRAQYNGENIDIAKNSEHAKSYATRFIELKQGKL